MFLKNDTTAKIIESDDYQEGFSPKSPKDPPVPQSEVDEFLLREAKFAKIKSLKRDSRVFQEAGFVYSGDTFKANARTMGDIVSKNICPVSDPDRYKFYDNPPEQFNNPRKQIDFVDAVAWTKFIEAMSGEYDRVMKKYNWYREAIDKCTTIAELNAIVFDFAA